MRQAGRHLPEYRELRQKHAFTDMVSTPHLAAEATLQPIRRYGMDGAVIFADIMTPLQAMGVDITFDPGPKLSPLGLAEINELPDPDPDRIGLVGETIRLVKDQVPDEVAVVGFAGGPATLLAYLAGGGGSKEHLDMRSILRSDPVAGAEALARLGRAMNQYLAMQTEAGADVVQLFDTWAGLLDLSGFERWAVPSARLSLADLDVPTIYFSPGAGHALSVQPQIGATGYGVDWRLPMDIAWEQLGDVAIQGNLDPAVLLTDPETIGDEVATILGAVDGRAGHIFNLGHGIDQHTPPHHVEAMVKAVRR